jgi:secreted protein with Ig-like and vWFA domain
MFKRSLRYWPIPAALAVAGIVATCAGGSGRFSHRGEPQKATRSPAAAARPVTTTAAAPPAANPAPAVLPAVPAALSERRRANLVFLVDLSASMKTPGKLPLVQQTLRETVDFLSPRDRVAIVVTGGGAPEGRLLLPPTPVSNRAALMDIINGLPLEAASAAKPTAPTGPGGLALAYAQASRAFVTGGINHVLLLTDAALVDLLPLADDRMARLVLGNREDGVTLTVLGYGANAVDRPAATRLGHVGAQVAQPIRDESEMHTYVRERLLFAADGPGAPRM